MLMTWEWWSRRSRMALAIDRVAAEDLAPGTEAFVAGQDDAATFVAARDHLEEQIALELVERQIADLVDDRAGSGSCRP